MASVDSMSIAAEAGLNYVTDEVPGFRRVRRGKGFSYMDPKGNTIPLWRSKEAWEGSRKGLWMGCTESTVNRLLAGDSAGSRA